MSEQSTTPPQAAGLVPGLHRNSVKDGFGFNTRYDWLVDNNPLAEASASYGG